ncbi:spermidine synthase-like protein [Phytoactinopolyspora alkaliphila]|uniref:Spermidine synthase-like protein n=1 Tax=Phytoactinopolyspora alkaliphila TaxID=1783498 RepID=A0A6N9YFP1_9ACTN|nr:spermidine synthase-like protein [Phytoactinopolyspora alkaliphila]
MPSRRSQRHPAPIPGKHATDTGTVELVADEDGKGGWLVLVNGVASSYVDPGDPTRLEFEYVQWTARVLDVAAPEGEPMSAVHIGGAGCTLPLYLAFTRPGSRQLVLEVDAALATLARQAFGLRGVRGLRIKAADGRAGIAELPDRSVDVVVRDAFDGSAVPAHLTTVEYHREVGRVLRPDGIYVANVADNAQVRESRAEAVAARSVFADVAMIAEPAQFRGRRFGNVLLVASQSPLPEDVLIRRLAGGAVRARYVDAGRVKELVAGVRARADADIDAGGSATFENQRTE